MSSPMGVDGLLETTTKDCKKTDHTTKAEEEHTDLLTRSTHVNMPSSELTVQSLFGVKGLVAVVTGGGSGTPLHPASRQLQLNFL